MVDDGLHNSSLASLKNQESAQDVVILSSLRPSPCARDYFLLRLKENVKGAIEARIRIQLSAAHTPEQLDQAARAFAEVGKELRIVG